MSVALSNVIFNTQRAITDPSTGVSYSTSLHLEGVRGHAEPSLRILAQKYSIMPTTAISADYIVSVDKKTDIQVGDIVTDITENNGVTPWPNDFGSGTTWHVNYVDVTGAGPLSERMVYIKRLTTSGPTTPLGSG